MDKKYDKNKGISVKKNENFSRWYAEVVQKAELADYAPIKGFMVIKPNAYSIWEKIQENFNITLKKLGIKNAYFPLLIPESFFKREAEHAEGFSPELAYIREKEEGERLALRPTSETIMYDSYSKWIRSWRDLPFQLNQWCNIIRWEVKQTKPFIRTREFLWQEGHGVFENEEKTIKNMNEIIHEYKKLIENLLAIPVLIGRKSEMERFPGAVTTMSVEALMPDGKALQCGTSHNLGQGFAKVFNIKFKGKDKKIYYGWQTSWGFSTRLIGALIMTHGDDKGIVLPPKVAENKIVIVPIYKSKDKENVLKKIKTLKNKLKDFGVIIDDREEYTPGWKFNEWELKGIPLRLEIGPKEIERKKIVVVRRDNKEKEIFSENNINKKIKEILEKMQREMFEKAKKFLESRIDKSKNMNDLKKKLKEGKIIKAYMKDSKKVEELIKEETEGASSRIIEDSLIAGECIKTREKVKTIAYISRGY